MHKIVKNSMKCLEILESFVTHTFSITLIHKKVSSTCADVMCRRSVQNGLVWDTRWH